MLCAHSIALQHLTAVSSAFYVWEHTNITISYHLLRQRQIGFIYSTIGAVGSLFMMDSPPAHFNFSDLPNEILLNIIEHEVFHENLENLALSSKTVFEWAKPARTKHLQT